MSEIPRLTRTLLVVANVLCAAFLIAIVPALVPGPAEAAERGVVPQLVMTWLLIAVAVVSALLLATMLLRRDRTRSVPAPDRS
jgi:hypothetical protein